MTNITTAVRGALGVIELDRPAALNALTHAAAGCVRDGAGELWVTVNFWG